MRTFFCFTLVLFLSACSDLGYYWNVSRGHLALMSQRVDIDVMLEQPNLDADLRQRLLLVQQIRTFSVDRLALPESDSYNNYVQLDRPYVLQNLFAVVDSFPVFPQCQAMAARGPVHRTNLLRHVEKG